MGKNIPTRIELFGGTIIYRMIHTNRAGQAVCTYNRKIARLIPAPAFDGQPSYYLIDDPDQKKPTVWTLLITAFADTAVHDLMAALVHCPGLMDITPRVNSGNPSISATFHTETSAGCAAFDCGAFIECQTSMKGWLA